MKREFSFKKGLLCLLGAIAGAVLSVFTTLWVGIIVALIFILIVCLDKRSFLMCLAIKKGKLSDAIQIGEAELRKGSATTVIKLNLIAAYYKNGDIDKALAIMNGIDIDKLSWSEKKVFDSWRIKIKEFQK